MGWGKGKGKAVERALHHAEREEERAAGRALAHGNIAGAIAHAQKSEALEHAEHAMHWKGKGKGYRHAAEVVVVPAAEVTPVVVAVPAEAVAIVPVKGAGKAAERVLHHEVVHARAERAHRTERREEHLAARDLAHGDVIGAISHEVRAVEAHHRGDRLEAELHHEHWGNHHKGWGKGKGKGKGWW